VIVVSSVSGAQDRLKTYPGYDRYAKMRSEAAAVQAGIRKGQLAVTWRDGGSAFDYSQGGKRWRYVIADRKAIEAPAGAEADDEAPGGFGQFGGRRGGGGVARGRQAETVFSPDRTMKATYKDRNVWLSKADGTESVALTTDGSEKSRVKYGSASWVYGEELVQRTAMWWSPDGKRLAFYRFDESKVPDFTLALKQSDLYTAVDTEAYPKPGTPNPVADLVVYDLASRKSAVMDVRVGKPFDDTVVGHYVYNVRWNSDGSELLFNRMNRLQNVMEIAAVDPATGKCRVVVHEERPTGWAEQMPALTTLKDGKRFILASERTGFRNFYLYDLSGKLLATLTKHGFDVDRVVRVDEERGQLFYTARSGDNPLRIQLHRVGLDGSGDRRITDPALNHTVSIAPDGAHFIDVAQTAAAPPSTRLLDAEGKVLAELAKADLTRYDTLAVPKPEIFTFRSADGKTELFGTLQRPANFDPGRRYPLLVSVYGGPESGSVRETFATPSPTAELGFLMASIDGRNASGFGRKGLDALYKNLGIVEIDDLAEGVKALRQRPYVDGSAVGIYGTSYGGYASVMCLLRHPEVFQAACASSPVVDWRQYDSIYTERFMGLPQDNKSGYDAGSALTYAPNLKGRLMLYFGTADNNVHPNNTMQLVRALQRAGKSFELQVGPDQGHSGLQQERMLEFFVENLVLWPKLLSGSAGTGR
jgi:dipeptidyl-peptidase 4